MPGSAHGPGDADARAAPLAEPPRPAARQGLPGTGGQRRRAHRLPPPLQGSLLQEPQGDPLRRRHGQPYRRHPALGHQLAPPTPIPPLPCPPNAAAQRRAAPSSTAPRAAARRRRAAPPRAGTRSSRCSRAEETTSASAPTRAPSQPAWCAARARAHTPAAARRARPGRGATLARDAHRHARVPQVTGGAQSLQEQLERLSLAYRLTSVPPPAARRPPPAARGPRGAVGAVRVPAAARRGADSPPAACCIDPSC